MQGPVCIRPGVGVIEQIIQAASIAGNGPNPPVVPAEMNLLGGEQGQGTDAFDDGNRDD
jgi:hypothetical protein